MYGAEYETNTLSDFMSKLVHHDVPCAVCLVRNRSVLKMFPGKTKQGNYNFRAVVTLKNEYQEMKYSSKVIRTSHHSKVFRNKGKQCQVYFSRAVLLVIRNIQLKFELNTVVALSTEYFFSKKNMLKRMEIRIQWLPHGRASFTCCWNTVHVCGQSP